MSDAMDLNYNEADVLARRLVVHRAMNPQDWLEWEDLPNLGEYAFERLVSDVKAFGEVLLADLRVRETVLSIDAADLEERAS